LLEIAHIVDLQRAAFLRRFEDRQVRVGALERQLAGAAFAAGRLVAGAISAAAKASASVVLPMRLGPVNR